MNSMEKHKIKMKNEIHFMQYKELYRSTISSWVFTTYFDKRGGGKTSYNFVKLEDVAGECLYRSTK